MVEIDGNMGEGGGQIVRTALSLSVILGTPFHIINIRRKRSKPGLRAQHAAAVRVMQEISHARVEGASIGSDALLFQPEGVSGGDYRFDIGTAGAITLVLETLLPPLLFAKKPSRCVMTGGTHVPLSPPFHFIKDIFLPLLARMGARVSAHLHAFGFYPRGGGEAEAYITPCARGLKPLSLKGDKESGVVTGTSAAARLPLSVAERQRDAARALLEMHEVDSTIEAVSVPAPSPGTFIFIKSEGPDCSAGFSSTGIRGKRAEVVGAEAAGELLAYRSRPGCLDPHLADQIVLYLALAGGESTVTTTAVSQHLVTNLEVIGKFLAIDYTIRGEVGEPGTITVRPPAELPLP